MRRNVLETALAAMVLMVAGIFLVFASNIGNVAPVTGYHVVAKFNSVDGLKVGDDVRIGGVKIGSVTAIGIDQKRYRSVVSMAIRPELKLPKDTSVAVASAGILGGKYIILKPGKGDRTDQSGLELTNTVDFEPVETTIGKKVFGLGGGTDF
jgi:phospholipid/cholesterol/gamma-HCH transport system substrate-binding protein